jgi:hypothetical protein
MIRHDRQLMTDRRCVLGSPLSGRSISSRTSSSYVLHVADHRVGAPPRVARDDGGRVGPQYPQNRVGTSSPARRVS